MTNTPRYWGAVTTMPAPMLTGIAQQLEAAGLEGVFAPQVYGPPFIPLAAAAAATERIRLASGIAIAFARSPFETATAAMDLDTLSGGRFTLGLGTSVRSWSEGFFGMEYGRPVEHLREIVDIVRTIWRSAHTGELKEYQGKYHTLDFSEFQPIPPPVRVDIPIWIACLRTPLVRLAAEVADGVVGHPIWSIEWATSRVIDDLAEGLRRGGRDRSEVNFNVWLWVAPNNDRRQAIEDAKATVAFYGGIAQYEEYFAAHGFRNEARALQEGVKRGDFMSVKHMVTDEMAQTFVVCGTPDEVRQRVSKIWEPRDRPDRACLRLLSARASTKWAARSSARSSPD